MKNVVFQLQELQAEGKVHSQLTPAMVKVSDEGLVRVEGDCCQLHLYPLQEHWTCLMLSNMLAAVACLTLSSMLSFWCLPTLLSSTGNQLPASQSYWAMFLTTAIPVYTIYTLICAPSTAAITY